MPAQRTFRILTGAVGIGYLSLENENHNRSRRDERSVMNNELGDRPTYC